MGSAGQDVVYHSLLTYIDLHFNMSILKVNCSYPTTALEALEKISNIFLSPHLLKKLRCDKCIKIQFKMELFINKPFVVVTEAEVVFLLLLLPEELIETLPELVEDLLSPLHGSFPSLC